MVSILTQWFRLPFEAAFRMLSELFRIMVEENGSFNDCEGWKSILCTTVMVSILTQWFRLPFEVAFRMLSDFSGSWSRKMALSTTARAGKASYVQLLWLAYLLEALGCNLKLLFEGFRAFPD